MARSCERVRRYLTFVTGIIECIGFAGLLFGWPSLVFVLKKEEYFADLCLSLHNTSDSGARNATDCDLQDERFALIFTISTFVMPVATVGNGFLLDYFGTVVTHLLAIFIYTTGTLLIAFSATASPMLLFPALSFVGVGGVILLVTNIQVGNLFWSKRSTVITLFNGAFDSSAVVVLVVKLVYEAGFSLMSIFLFISCLSFIHVLRTIFLFPRRHIPYPLPEGYTYGVNCAVFRCSALSMNSRREEAESEEGHREELGEGYAVNGREDTEGHVRVRWKQAEEDAADGGAETNGHYRLELEKTGRHSGEGREETERDIGDNGQEAEGDERKEVKGDDEMGRAVGDPRKTRMNVAVDASETDGNTAEGMVKMDKEQLKEIEEKMREGIKGGIRERKIGVGAGSDKIESHEAQKETEGDLREESVEMESERDDGSVDRVRTTADGPAQSTNAGDLQPSGAEGSLNNEKEEEIPSFQNCVFSSLFLTHLLWFSVIQLRFILFIGTINPMLDFLADGDPGQVSKFTNALGIIQFCGILCAPWNGLILDRHKWRNKRLDTSGSAVSERLADMQSAVLSLAITVTFSVAFTVCAAIPVLEVQYLTFILLTFNRAFLYGGLNAFIVMTFPLCHFGKTLGMSFALAAVVSLLQYPWLILVNGPLQGNPLYLNIALIALVTLSYVHPINVYFYCRRETRRRILEATPVPAQQ
ncbi:equilibrative nucleobase transporter 1-like [Leucoraja erinacea]|uniref:equilibrative nucleobase transporter 1-like n=1 Tax=Leucoraja erinaceus TaxID=7782 RepID=UPI002455C334|nr:equilibrative nucleobase transporter 1-like [Leucoraja erinacea]